jgi:hypothetical protein
MQRLRAHRRRLRRALDLPPPLAAVDQPTAGGFAGLCRGFHDMNARAPYQFGLLSLLLAVSVFAVVCSLWKMAPALGIVATAACLIGALGVWGSVVDAGFRGEFLTYRQKLRAFFETAAVAVVTPIVVLVVAGLFLASLWLLMR